MRSPQTSPHNRSPSATRDRLCTCSLVPSQPAAAPRTLALYAELADAVWHAAGDTATDLSW